MLRLTWESPTIQLLANAALERHSDQSVSVRRLHRKAQRFLFDRIRPVYTSITIKDRRPESLEANTKLVNIRYEDHLFSIGRFRIRLVADPDDSGQVVSIKNLDRVNGGLHHPHIEYSTPCFGNYEDRIDRAIRHQDYLALLVCCWEFLISYNEDNCQGSIDRWRRKKS